MSEPMHFEGGKRPRPVVLCILDGWGHRDKTDDNAVTLARTPNLHRFWKYSPHALLEASEEWVGLPSGQIGNSEVGHMNLGAGRVVMQDLPRIDKALADGELQQNPQFVNLIAKVKAAGGTVHILGLVSEGGVHSHQSHTAGLARTVSEAGVPVVIHVLTDGRDVPPQAAEGEIGRFLEAIAPFGNAMRGANWTCPRGRYDCPRVPEMRPAGHRAKRRPDHWRCPTGRMAVAAGLDL